MSTVNFLVVSDVRGNGLYQSSIVDRQAKCEWSWPWWMTNTMSFSSLYNHCLALLFKGEMQFLGNKCYWNAAYCCMMTLIDMNVKTGLVLILTDWSCAWQVDHVVGRLIMWLHSEKESEWMGWVSDLDKGTWWKIIHLHCPVVPLLLSSGSPVCGYSQSHPSRWNKNM